MRFRALVPLAVLGLPSSLAIAATPPEGARILRGEDVVERPGSGSPWSAPTKKDRLHAGWDIKCASGCVLGLPGGGQVTLEPGSELRDRVAIFARVDDKFAVRAIGLELRSGGARIDLFRSQRAVVLESPTGAAILVPSGGAASAVAHGREASFGATRFDGHARAPHARWHGLAEGVAVDVRENALIATRALPAAPAWQISGRNAGPVGLAEPSSTGRVGGVWNPVTGASKYAIEIARDERFTDLVVIRTSDAAHAAEDLAPGKYFARVAGVDGTGLAGPTSKARALRVVTVIVPPGGLADGSTLVVPPSRALEIGESDGLEFGIGRPAFQKLAALDLKSAASSGQLWMRFSGDATSASMVKLEPRALRAEVEISPRNAHWPSDPIDVTVRLSDPSHRVDPASIEPKLKAMLEVDEMPLAWSHDGAVWRAHVKPRGILHNTVVRVEATDEHDNPLGRGFAEIVPTIVEPVAAR